VNKNKEFQMDLRRQMAMYVIQVEPIQIKLFILPRCSPLPRNALPNPLNQGKKALFRGKECALGIGARRLLGAQHKFFGKISWSRTDSCLCTCTHKQAFDRLRDPRKGVEADYTKGKAVSHGVDGAGGGHNL